MGRAAAAVSTVPPDPPARSGAGQWRRLFPGTTRQSLRGAQLPGNRTIARTTAQTGSKSAACGIDQPPFAADRSWILYGIFAPACVRSGVAREFPRSLAQAEASEAPAGQRKVPG